jgi:hypothetical protein
MSLKQFSIDEGGEGSFGLLKTNKSLSEEVETWINPIKIDVFLQLMAKFKRSTAF